jgi:hypothetical protein
MSDERRIASIRSWRDQARHIYGVPHQRGDSDLVCNNKAWWADVEALLVAADEGPPRCATCVHWSSADDVEGACGRIGADEGYSEVSPLIMSDAPAHLITPADFGCTEHQPKPEENPTDG